MANLQKTPYRTANIRPNLDMTGFVGVMFAVFLLTLVLIVPTPFHRGVGVDLPQASHPVAMPKADREDALTIAIMRDGQVYFGNERLNLRTFPHALQEKLEYGAERRVYIKADARSRYQAVKNVLNNIYAAVITDVSFLVDQKRAPAFTN
jgi:biopolymer transport protein TolR